MSIHILGKSVDLKVSADPEILSHLELVVNTVSMEEAVQQQSQTMEAAPGEAATGT